MSDANHSETPLPSGFESPRHGSGYSMTLRVLLAHRRCDRLSGWLVYFLVIFSPWAFGTVRPPAIWTVNIACYLLGLLLLSKWILRLGRGNPPDRLQSHGDKSTASRWLDVIMAVLTVGLLAYCFLGAFNARATYVPFEMVFLYHDHISWLPHSYDSSNTWDSLARFIALACFFWALRDWLAAGMLTKSARIGMKERIPFHRAFHRGSRDW